MTDKRKSDQSEGRTANAAQPPGNTPPVESKSGREKTARRSREAAGPDGPDAGVVGRTFKSRPS